QVLSLEGTLWRLHLPGISDPFRTGKGGLHVHGSASLLCQSQIGKSHAVRVYYPIGGSVGCTSKTGGIKGNEALCLLNGENFHGCAYAFLQCDAFQVLAPA